MAKTRVLEISVGMFVFAGIAALLILAINVSNVSSFSPGGVYSITAKFDNASGLKERSAVTIAGVTIGRVTSIVVDPVTFEAVVKMDIDERFNEIPVDSIPGIYTAGLLGEKYVGIIPGGAPDYFEDGTQTPHGNSSIVLEELISKFMFSQSEK